MRIWFTFFLDKNMSIRKGGWNWLYTVSFKVDGGSFMELRYRNFWLIRTNLTNWTWKWTLSSQWSEYLSQILSNSNRTQKIGLGRSHSSTPNITLQGISGLGTVYFLSKLYKGLVFTFFLFVDKISIKIWYS